MYRRVGKSDPLLYLQMCSVSCTEGHGNLGKISNGLFPRFTFTTILVFFVCYCSCWGWVCSVHLTARWAVQSEKLAIDRSWKYLYFIFYSIPNNKINIKTINEIKIMYRLSPRTECYKLGSLKVKSHDPYLWRIDCLISGHQDLVFWWANSSWLTNGYFDTVAS